MEAAADPCPPEHREWVDGLRHAGPIPLSTIQDPVPNSWACPPGNVFSLRGPGYMETKAKIAGGEWLLQPLAFDFFHSSCQIANIMKHPQCRVRAALDAAIRADPQSQHQPFVWAFNLQLGTKSHHSMVYYFVSFRSPPEGSLMQRFLDDDEDDAFRNSRMKLLTRLPEAPWLVRVVVGERWPVCMLGKVLKCTYTREMHYIEVDVNVASSTLAATAVKLVFNIEPIVSDVAFVLEGTHPDELPESILGAIRHVKMEASAATHLDMSEVIQGDSVPKSVKESRLMKFLKFSSNDHRPEVK